MTSILPPPWSGWTDLRDARVASRKARAADACAAICEFLRKEEPWLYEGKMRASVEFDEICQIQEKLLANLEFDLRHEVVTQFRQVLAAGNLKKIWHVPLPNLELRIMAPSPLVRPIDFAGRRAFRALLDEVIARLPRLADNRAAKTAVLQIGALAGGGILRQTDADHLPFLTAGQVIRANGLLIVDFGDQKAGTFWFPGALPQLILWQSALKSHLPLRDRVRDQVTDVRARLKSLVATLNAPECDGFPAFPEALSQGFARVYENLSGTAKANAAKFGCGAFLAHASGLNRTHPLRRTTWYRLIFDRPLRRTLPLKWRDREEPVDQADDPPPPAGSESSLPKSQSEALIRSVQHKLYKLMKADDGITAEGLLTFAEEKASTLPDASLLALELVAWLKKMLTEPADHRWDISAIYREFNRIWRAVLAVETEGCPEPHDADGWADFLASCFFLLATQKTASKAVKALKLFHGLLVERGKAPSLDYRDIEGFDTTGEAFDPNIVTPREYREALLRLGANPDEDARRVCIRRLVTILGFRCGLRREEVRFLEVRSIDPSDRPILVVEDTPRRRLKSAAGNRRLPLHVLLAPDELAELIRFARERRANVGPETRRLLFVLDEDRAADLPVSDEILFDPIQRALRMSSGDPDLVFHHLRHAFVNWLLLRLLLSRSERFRSTRLSVLGDPMLAATECERLRAGIYCERQGGASDPGARDIYLVAMLVGHSSPSVTLKSYFHLADWLVSCLSEDGEIRLQPKAAAQFLGISTTTVGKVQKARSDRKRGITIAGLNAFLCKDGVFSDLAADDVTMPAASWSGIVTAAKFDYDLRCLDAAGNALATLPRNAVVAIEQMTKLAPNLGKISQETAEYLSVSGAVVADWVNRIRLLELGSETSAARTFKLLASPHQNKDQRDFMALLRTVSMLSSGERASLLCRVTDWLKSFAPITGAFQFAWDEQRATDFMGVLDVLGISPDRIVIRIQLGRAPDALRPGAVEMLGRIFRIGAESIRIKSDGNRISHTCGTLTEVFILQEGVIRGDKVRIGNLSSGYRFALSAFFVFAELF